MTRTEFESSEHVAEARIHVERIIQRIRTFHILDTLYVILPITGGPLPLAAALLQVYQLAVALDRPCIQPH